MEYLIFLVNEGYVLKLYVKFLKVNELLVVKDLFGGTEYVVLYQLIQEVRLLLKLLNTRFYRVHDMHVLIVLEGIYEVSQILSIVFKEILNLLPTVSSYIFIGTSRNI